MFSVARSRLALPVQLSFLGAHSVGLLLGTIYTNQTPNLYENNSHNKLGWIVTWIVVGQCIIGVIKLATSIVASRNSRNDDEQARVLPISIDAMAQHRPSHGLRSPDPYRYSDDSGHFTASRSHSMSSSQDPSEEEQQKLYESTATHNDEDASLTEKHGLLSCPEVERIARYVSAFMSRRTMRVLDFAHDVVDRGILLLGFITFIAGAAVYGGAFVSLVSS